MTNRISQTIILVHGGTIDPVGDIGRGTPVSVALTILADLPPVESS